MRIILVDDDPQVANQLRKDLEADGHQVDCLRYRADEKRSIPFSSEELLDRFETTNHHVEPVLAYGDLKLDLFRRIVERDGKAIPLTNREFDLLFYFMNNPDRVLHRDSLAADVWNMPFETNSNIVDVYVTYLRRKLSRVGVRMIHSVRGQGYRFGA